MIMTTTLVAIANKKKILASVSAMALRVLRVSLREFDMPADAKPMEWRLLTNRTATSPVRVWRQPCSSIPMKFVVPTCSPEPRNPPVRFERGTAMGRYIRGDIFAASRLPLPSLLQAMMPEEWISRFHTGDKLNLIPHGRMQSGRGLAPAPPFIWTSLRVGVSASRLQWWRESDQRRLPYSADAMGGRRHGPRPGEHQLPCDERQHCTHRHDAACLPYPAVAAYTGTGATR
jgi:hypothetical protein